MNKSRMGRHSMNKSSLIFGIVIFTLLAILWGIAHEAEYRHQLRMEKLMALEHQQKQYRQMLKETHELYNLKERPTFCINTESMTARELLWHMEKQFGDNDNIQIE